MSLHAAQTGSAAGAALEGFLSGAQTGISARRQRTTDAQNAEETRRRRIAEQVAAGRQGVTDEQTAARASREADRFRIELHDQGLERLPTGAPTGVPQPVLNLRSGVAATIDPTNAPPGFRRFAPSPEQREQTEADEVAQLIGAYIRDPGAFDLGDLTNVQALISEDLVDNELRRRTAAAAPSVSSPLQLLPGPEGLMSTFDPRGEPGERVAPLLGPSGEQFRGRVPADNFARSNAQAAMNAMSRLDPFVFEPGEIMDAERERVAQRYGFESVSHAEQVLAEAVGGGGAPPDTGVDDFEPLLREALGSPSLSEEEKELAQEIADGPEFEGQRSELLRNLLGINDAGP